MSNADPKVAFDNLYNSLVEYQQLFFESSLRATTLLLLIMGWIITSDNATKFLHDHEQEARIGGWALVICAIAYVGLCMRLLWIVRGLGRELAAIDFLPRSYYAHRILHPAVAAMWMVLPMTPFAAIASYLLSRN
jgi:hypothetical protein